MKHTAVDQLRDRLLKEFGFAYSDNIHEELKEIEKEQIIDSFVECWKENMPEGYECKQSAEYYYNETFNNTQS